MQLQWMEGATLDNRRPHFRIFIDKRQARNPQGYGNTVRHGTPGDGSLSSPSGSRNYEAVTSEAALR